jgi:hypothetical protein
MRPLVAVFVLSLSVVVAPALVYGDGWVSLFSDASLENCTLSDSSPGEVNVYIAEFSPDGATGLRFRVAASPGFTGVWLSEVSPFLTIGTSVTDLAIGFGHCMVGQAVVLTMRYQLFGTSTCSDLSIVAPPGFPQPLCSWCVFNEAPCNGFRPLHVNCAGPFECNPVATESATWGKVKALYRN